MQTVKILQTMVTVKVEQKLFSEAMKLAKDSVEMVDKLIDNDNYLRAKALVHLSKALCGIKDVEEAEIVSS